ncbi:MAG: aminopeptidase P N-terminal domain-containing protein [Ignavibacteriae bacterium]|nr:aminopeptidase P N-terminal domain-containing protein [Ignavibacteriota bacterium]
MTLQLAFHKSRRQELLKQIDKHSLALVFGATFKHKSYDYDFHLKQNRNFFYLTGFEEPNAALLLAPGGIKVSAGKNKFKNVKEILFVQQKDKSREVWTGKRLGFENVNKELGIEYGQVNSEIMNFLTSNLTPQINKLYINIPELYALTGEMKRLMVDFYERLFTLTPNVHLIDINYLIGKLRFVKTGYEISQMKRSAGICVTAFQDAISQIGGGLYEYQVQSVLEYNYKAYGAMDTAFNTIVASGNNACTLHYETNQDILKEGDLVLIDSGCEYNGYNSDITRTVPVSGVFTKEQKEIYQLVLKVQKDVIKKIKPGVKLSYLKQYTRDALAKGLIALKIIKKKEEVTKYYMHGVGHHLGLDTHDAVKFGYDEKFDYDILKAGNIITVEPGLYISKDSDSPVKYRGIGIRIEDDVLVTKNGNEILTASLAKDIADLENMMSS